MGFDKEIMEKEKFKQKILNEVKKIVYYKALTPQGDWDLIFVLSAFENDFKDGSGGKRNENKDRLDTALTVARQVAAIRAKRRIKDVKMQDMADFLPQVIYIGTNVQNDNLRNIADDFLGQRNFSNQKLIILENVGIKNTQDQIKEIPNHFSGNERKIVVISNAYHLPRIKRYLKVRPDKFDFKKMILYPSNPKKVQVKKVLEEAKKIQKYIKDGILPQEKYS